MGNCCALSKPSSESLGGNNYNGLYDNCVCESLTTALSLRADDFMCLQPRSYNEKRPHLSELNVYPSVHILRELSNRITKSGLDCRQEYLKLLEDKSFLNFDKNRNGFECPIKKIKQKGCNARDDEQQLWQTSMNSELPKPVLLNLTDDAYQCYNHMSDAKSNVNWRCKMRDEHRATYVTPVEVEDFITAKQSEEVCLSAQEDLKSAEQESSLFRFCYDSKTGYENESCLDEMYGNPSTNWGLRSQYGGGRCSGIGGECPLSSILEKLVQNAVLSKVTIEGLNERKGGEYHRRINERYQSDASDGETLPSKTCTVFIDGDPYPLEKVIFIPRIKPAAGDYLATKCTLDTQHSSRVLLISTDFLPSPSATSKDESCSNMESEGSPKSTQSVPVRRLFNPMSQCQRAVSTPNFKPLPFEQPPDRPFTYANTYPDWSTSSDGGRSLSKTSDVSLKEDDKINSRPCSKDFFTRGTFAGKNIKPNSTSCCSKKNEFLYVQKKARVKSEAALNPLPTRKKIKYSSIGKLFHLSEPSSGNISQKSSFLYIKRCNLSTDSKKESFLRVQSRKRRSQYLSVPQDVREN